MIQSALGTMTLSGGYGAISREMAVRVLVGAVETGVKILDTADAYLDGEERVAAALRMAPDHAVTVVTKAGLVGAPGRRSTQGDAASLRAACVRSLRRLGVDALDVWLLHRVDPRVPVEESIGAMSDLVARGDVQSIGICSAEPDVVQRAHRVHPLSFVQTEFSLIHPEPAITLLPILDSLGITLMAHSPLSRGLLARRDLPDTFPVDDARAHIPEFADGAQRAFARDFHKLADDLLVSPVALALAWLTHRNSQVQPIPGARTRAQVIANSTATRLRLSGEDWKRVDQLTTAPRIPPGTNHPRNRL